MLNMIKSGNFMGHETLITKGKNLAFLLRHDLKYTFEPQGWRQVSDIISNHNISRVELDEIVKTDNKNRYEYSDDKSKIRARQGHSIAIDLGLQEQIPPDILYHGTATKYLKSIYDNGIIKGNRQYVHLSKDEETAINVGRRHGTPIVLFIDCKQMVLDGIKFYLSTNDVWLTNYIDHKYINNIQ